MAHPKIIVQFKTSKGNNSRVEQDKPLHTLLNEILKAHPDGSLEFTGVLTMQEGKRVNKIHHL
jgi:hypothetical protein